MFHQLFTPAHVAIECLVIHTLLKGLQDSLGAHKDEKWCAGKWVDVILDTLLYATAGRRSNV